MHLHPRTNDAKERAEAWAAVAFARAAGLSLDDAPTNIEPPMPDIECWVNGTKALFEVAEILDSGFAEGLEHSQRQSHKKMEALSLGRLETASSAQTTGIRGLRANESLARILRQKSSKNYKTNGLPTSLLLFYSTHTPWGPFEYLLQSSDEFAALVASSVFKRVWLFDLPDEVVMGYIEVTSDGKLRAQFDVSFSFDQHRAFEALIPTGSESPDKMGRFRPVLLQAKAGKSQPAHRSWARFVKRVFPSLKAK